eukprot:854921-Pyramimonas_sp.AAC.1
MLVQALAQLLPLETCLAASVLNDVTEGAPLRVTFSTRSLHVPCAGVSFCARQAQGRIVCLPCLLAPKKGEENSFTVPGNA